MPGGRKIPLYSRGNRQVETQFYKLKFPTFDGSKDTLPWLTHVEQFFDRQGTPESGTMWLAIYHLAGQASFWYRRFKREHGSPPWDEFSMLLNCHFRPKILKYELTTIKKLH
jgi:hypothetical protein